MKISCLIIEDEPLAQKGLSEFISRLPDLQLAGIANDPLEALKIMEQHDIDLIFLDIEMPGMNGFTFLRTLDSKSPPSVIITTAYPDYALNSYEFEVTDYLVKPISFERFVKALDKARKHIGRADARILNDMFFIKVNKKLEAIKLKDLLYIEAMEHYVIIHTSKAKHIAYLSLADLQNKLPSMYVRIHKSFIVPVDKIERIEQDRVVIQGNTIPMSKNYRQKLMDVIENKIYKK